MKVDSVKGSVFVVMDKDTTQAKLYEHYLSFFLPEGMLDFFGLVWMETESLTSRESQQDVRPNGFTEPTTMPDFPVRDRRVELHIRRRRWLPPEVNSLILNIYPLVAEGTRCCFPPIWESDLRSTFSLE